ncbi:hypothetical protein CASFOL_009083 [Castilleja foliolosa]|uniref:Uncharacterized protein n=1 Tax=Castilleja foliolosa TaxID=1961234 RepID=A0ABD3E4V6_9LAMI
MSSRNGLRSIRLANPILAILSSLCARGTGPISDGAKAFYECYQPAF